MLRLERRKNSGIWRIRGTHHGVPIDQSARTRARSEAQSVLEAIERDIFAQKYGSGPSVEKAKHTLNDAAVSWIEAGGNVEAFPYFELIIISLGDIPLDEITQGTIDKAALKAMPTQSVNTRKRHFYTPVGVLLNHAAEERMMPYFRLKRPQEKKFKTRIITPPEFETLAQADPDFAATMTFLIGTGARTHEAFSLQDDDISPYGSRVTFWDTKGEKPRSVDLCPRTRAAMPPRQRGIVWRSPDTDLPWVITGNNRYHGPATRIRRLTESLGWKGFGPHTFRHSWASWRYSLHTDRLRLKLEGGWSDDKMIDRYVHLGSPDLAQQVRDHGWFLDLQEELKKTA